MKFKLTIEKEKIIVEPLITIKEDTRKFRFILDTGAVKTAIDKSVADILRLQCYTSDNLITAGGKIKAQEAKIPKIELFGKELSDIVVNVIEFPYQITIFADGLIGMDFLKKFKHLNFDFENESIEVNE